MSVFVDRLGNPHGRFAKDRGGGSRMTWEQSRAQPDAEAKTTSHDDHRELESGQSAIFSPIAFSAKRASAFRLIREIRVRTKVGHGPVRESVAGLLSHTCYFTNEMSSLGAAGWKFDFLFLARPQLHAQILQPLLRGKCAPFGSESKLCSKGDRCVLQMDCRARESLPARVPPATGGRSHA